MELTISVSEETKAILEQKAAEQKQDVNVFVETIIKSYVLKPTLDGIPVFEDETKFETDMEAFAEGTENLMPYYGTYSREEIYFDHD
jgi:hypothetical protein